MGFTNKDTSAPKKERDFNTRPSKWDIMLFGAFNDARIRPISRSDGGLEIRRNGHRVVVGQHITRKSVFSATMSQLEVVLP